MRDRTGKVHTSTVTVAVLEEPTSGQLTLNMADVDITACRGSGAGGQHRNKVSSAIQIKHRPTGLYVRCETERSQHQNREIALAVLRARLWEARQRETSQQANGIRRDQIGSGMRGDKRRTVALHRGEAVDHITGKRWRIADYIKGNW